MAGERRKRGGGPPKATWPPAQEAKLLAKVAQPLPRHYNGQGVVQPSLCVPLHAEGFSAEFARAWDEHVDFGSSRSHKKLAKARPAAVESLRWEARVLERDGTTVVRDTAQDKKRKAPGSVPAVAAAAAVAPGKQAARPDQSAARKRTFAGTLAAKLLQGKDGG